MQKTIHTAAYGSLLALLREARRSARLSQAAVGKHMGVTRTWISKVEHAEVRLDIVQLIRLARLYRLRPEQVVRTIEKEL